MQPKKYARFASTGVKTLGLALASTCLFYSGADAAGLGKLTVLSALGQPLRAEIELTSVTSDDAGNLVTKLASQEAYRQANVEFNKNLNNIKFSVEERGSRRFVLVTSTQSVNEPFLEILLELNSGSGKLIREYTVLLDPVEMQANNGVMSTSNGTTVSSQPNIPAPVAPVTSSAPAPAATVAVPPPTPAPAAKNFAPNPASGATYQIKTGDTLSKIANQYKPDGVSLEQMLVALQHSNSGAFIDNNMNLLRSGKILTIPDAATIDQTNQSEAKKIVLAQSVDFSAYRNRMANQVEQAKPEKAIEPKKTDGGKITAKVTEVPTVVNESKDKLKLSKAQQAQELADKKAQEEEKIAKQRALEAANARVKELEANTAKLQNILDLKNKEAADSKLKATKEVPAVAPAVAASAPASLPTVEASIAASKPVIKPRPKVAPAPEPEVQPGFFEQYIKYLPYGAGILAILGLLGLMASKRKKKTEHFDDESILTGSSIKTNSLFGSTGGQSVDTNNSVFNSNFAPSASQLDANEVDPVAEADVYIAYGRDEQAEEILKEALRTQPDRQAVRVKLLEIYAHRKDIRTFETVASELYGMTSGEGPDWAQAASLGIMIDPQNPLYAGGQNVDHSTAALGASTLPVESLDPEALLGNSLSQHMLDSISAKGDSASSMMMGGTDVNDSTHRTEEITDGLDFDLGLATHPNADDDFGVSPVNKPSASFAAAEVAEPFDLKPVVNEIEVPDDNVLDFSAPPSTGSATLSSAPVSLPEDASAGGMDFAALDFDFDIPKSHPEELPQVEASAQQSDDIPMRETNYENTQSGYQPASASPTLDYDLSSINLDLPKVEQPLDALSDAAQADISADRTVDFKLAEDKTLELQQTPVEESVEFSSEMATKLDLAIAYQEIGDKDGARELLEEVLKGGNEEQIARAKTLMQELA